MGIPRELVRNAELEEPESAFQQDPQVFGKLTGD